MRHVQPGVRIFAAPSKDPMTRIPASNSAETTTETAAAAAENLATHAPGVAVEDSPRARAVQKRTVIVLVISQIIGTIGIGVAPTIGVLLAGQVTDSEAWAGLARTASTLGAALLGLPLGNLAAKRGRRVALSTGWWLAALGAVILIFAAQWSLIVPLFVGLLLIGAGSAVSLQSRFASMDLAAPKHKARTLALVVWVGTIGSVLGPNLGAPGAIVGDATGLTTFAAAFLIAAVCLTLAGAIVFITLRPDPLLLSVELHQAAAPAKPKSKRGSIGRILAEIRVNKTARIAVIAILTAQIVMVSIMTMTPVHIVHQGGSVNLVGITISLHVLGMYALAPVVGWVVDKFGHRVSISLGLAIFFLSLIAGAVGPDDMGWIMTSLVLLGLGWSFVNVTGSALFAVAVAPDVRASAQGGVDAMSNLCGATAAFAAGPLLAASNFSTLSIIAMFVLIPLGLMMLRRIPSVG